MCSSLWRVTVYCVMDTKYARLSVILVKVYEIVIEVRKNLHYITWLVMAGKKFFFNIST